MEAITVKTVKAVSLSGIALIVISLLVTTGIVLALLAIVRGESMDNFFDLLAIAVLGIAIYYLSFGILSYVFVKKIAKPAAGK